MSTTPSSEILQIIREDIKSGEPITVIAERFVDDSALETYYPELNALFQTIIDSTTKVHNILGI